MSISSNWITRNIKCECSRSTTELSSSGLCFGSVTVAFPFDISSYSIATDGHLSLLFTYSGRVLRPHKGLTHTWPSNVALIAQLGEGCTGIAEVVGSNPVQSLNLFQVFVPVVLRLHSHLIFLVSKFSAPTIAFLAFWLAKKLRLSANIRSFTSYGK